MDIVEFLTARLDEDEAAAHAAIADRSGTERWEAKGFPERDRIEWIVRDVEEKYASHGYPGYTPVAGVVPGGPRDGGGVAEHIARHDPARVLAEVKAKRAILAEHAIVYRNIGWLEDGEEEGAEIPVCGCCVSKHSHYLSRAEVPEGPCRTVRYLAAPYADHPDYEPAWAVG